MRLLFRLYLFLLLAPASLYAAPESSLPVSSGFEGDCIMSLLGRGLQSTEVMKMKDYFGSGAHEGSWLLGNTIEGYKGVQLLISKDNIVSGINIYLGIQSNTVHGRFKGKLPCSLSDTSTVKGIMASLGRPLESGTDWLKYYHDGVNIIIHFSHARVASLELTYNRLSDLAFDGYCRDGHSAPQPNNRIQSKGVIIMPDDIKAENSGAKGEIVSD